MSKPACLPKHSTFVAELPDPGEWIRRTSLTFSRRGPSTVAMDAGYASFYGAVGKPNEFDEALALFNRMSAYLKEKGGIWSKCERNQASKGLLARIYNELNSKFGMAGAHAAALARIDAVEVPHARFGVLYLLANVSVELSAMNYAAMALEGANVLGTAGALGGTFDIKANDPSNLKDGNAIFSATGKRMASQTVGLGKLGTQDIATLITAAGAPLTIGSKVTATDATTLPPQLQIHHKARAGAAFRNHGEWHRELAVLWQTIANKVGDVVARLRTRMLANGDWPYSLAGTVLKQIVSKAISKIFAAAAPYVGSAMDVLTGIARTISAAAEKMDAYKLRKKFELREGHPQELARSIEREMEWAIGGGIKDALKGVAGIASQVFLPGAGSLVSAVIAGVEWLAQSIMRLAESFRIKEFLREAHEIFQREPRIGRYEADRFIPAGKEQGGVVHSTERFAEFFRKGCKASPIIPMLTLNTGICGSLMVMIRMVNDLGQTSQDSFDAGADYFRRLKQYGAKYMRDSGFSFLPRSRSDIIVLGVAAQNRQKAGVSGIQGLLNHALNSHSVVSTTGSKIGAMLTA
ncbi:conserved hypothetical protein [Cupriavidus necator]|uniref:Uncharacterized protein n=1 Tax=Cupriavidus necator TaxID=106590 RepID=A0A1K0IHV1_CUPNE|nr:conserved hypothetical protein [Cupriavidus necator]